MRFFFLALFVCAGLTSYSQKINTFTGPYEVTAFLQKGEVTYQYYDDNVTYKRTRKGPFKFTFNGKDAYLGVNQVIEGNYKNDVKHGQWTYTLNYTDFKNGEYYQTGTMKLIANYVDGIPHGSWKASSTLKIRRKIYNRITRKMEFEPFKEPMSADLKANFQNGILMGSLVYNMDDKLNGKTANYTCAFDSLGFYHGKTVLRIGSSENIFEFEHGFLYKEVVRNLQSGGARVEDFSKELATVKQMRLSNNENDEYKLVADRTSPSLKPVADALKTYFFSKLWHFGDIYGDLQYNKTETFNPYQYEGLMLLYIRRK